MALATEQRIGIKNLSFSLVKDIKTIEIFDSIKKNNFVVYWSKTRTVMEEMC